MSETTDVGSTPDSSNDIPKRYWDIHNSKPFRDLTYKELQNISMKMNLPANLKHSQLVTMLDARQKGDEDTVRKILSEYKEQRCRKRTKNISLPMKRPMEVERKGKRRKLLPTNKFENYRSIMPHASTDSNGRRTTPSVIPHQDVTTEMVTHTTQSLLRSRLQQSSMLSMLPLTSPIQYPRQCDTPGITRGTYEEITNPSHSLYGKHQLWYPQFEERRENQLAVRHNMPVTYVQETPSYPSLTTSRYHIESKQPRSYEPMPQAYDLSTGRRTAFQSTTPSPLYKPQILPVPVTSQEISTTVMDHNIIPETRYSPLLPDILQHNQPLPFQHHVEEINGNTRRDIELILNTKKENYASKYMPKLWTSANTSIYQCYNAPLCTAFTTPTESDYLRQSEGNSGPSAMEETHIMELDTPSTSMEPWWGLGNQIQPQSLPDFRQNNQLSYPLIYDYVASTEEQLKQHQKQQQQKQNEEYHGLFNLDWSSDAQYRPQAMSSPNHTTSIGLFSNNLMLPTIPEVPQLDDDMLEIIHSQQEQENNEIQQQIPQKCRYHNRGCKKTITDMGDLIQHEMGCECQPMYCYNGCSWRGSLKQLSAHFHEVHSSEIVDNDESSHTFSLNEVRARQSIAFLREVNKKLYVVSVHCHGHLLYATIQSVRTGKSDRFLVKASLEVVGEDGRPHSWRGKVRPVYESLSTLWATEQCLVLDPATIGAFAGANIILHTKITTYPIDSKM